MSELPKQSLPRTTRGIDELWRQALGGELRRMRTARGERLDDTAARAGISPQYLSEIERGRKDASSEMIAAVIGALESNLADVLVRVAHGIGSAPVQVVDIRSASSFAVDAGRRASDAVLSIAA
jgi:transcriptional regulator with XRE-family HTH domain